MKKIIFIGVILIGILFNNNQVIIPKDSIRLRVIANSNEEYDQKIKQEVSKSIKEELSKTLRYSKDINTSRELIKNNIKNYENSIDNLLLKNNYNLPFSIDYGYHYFPEKVYKGVVYESGDYESLLVTIGEGKGDNWWCVLFPPLCMLEAEETNKNEVEYKSFILEIINNFIG